MKAPIARSAPLASFPGHSRGVLCVTSSPVTPASKDAPVLLATGAADGGVGVWAIKGKDCIGRYFITPHSAAVTRCESGVDVGRCSRHMCLCASPRLV